jgi:dolichyl-diphosphooligosaccharide--protein glycosyltransferase
MANRTTIVDNNTWNATHIARVGRILLVTEEQAYPLLLELGVTHVMVVCGAMTGVRSDDINKLIWPIRLGAWAGQLGALYFSSHFATVEAA